MKTLVERVHAWLESETFALPVATAGISHGAALLPFLPSHGKLHLQEAVMEATDPGKPLVVRGKGMEVPFQAATVTLQFWMQDDVLCLDVQAAFADKWRFAQSFPALAQSYADGFAYGDAKLSFSGNENEPGLWFEGAPVPEALPFSGLFTAFSPVLSGRIHLEDGIFDFRIGHMGHLPFELPTVGNEGFQFGLDNGGFRFGLDCSSNPVDPMPLPPRPVYLRGKRISPAQDRQTIFHAGFFFLETKLLLQIGEQAVGIPLEARIHNPHHDIVAIARLGEASEFALTALGSFLGQQVPLPDFLSTLNPANLVSLKEVELQLSPWLPSKISRVGILIGTNESINLPIEVEGQSPFAIEEIELRLDIVNPLEPKQSAWAIRLEALLRVGASGKLSMTGWLRKEAPNPTILIELLPGEPIHLGEMIQHFGKLDGANIPALEVEELQFSLDTKTKAWEFRVELKDLWRITSGDKTLELAELDAQIIYVPHEKKDGGKAGGDLGINVGAVLWVGDCEFRLLAQHPAEEDAGWYFEGHLNDDDEVNLAYIFESLHESTHFSLPETFPDVFIREVQVTYDTQSRDFTFSALTTVDLPIGDLRQDLFLAAQLSVAATHGEGDKTKVDVELAANLKVGEHEIDVSAHLNRHDQVLLASWRLHTDGIDAADPSGSGKTDGLHVAHLLQLLDPDHKDAAAAQGIDLVVNALAFEYAHSPAAHDFVFSAKTQEGFALYVVGQKRDQNWRFLLNVEFDELEAATPVPDIVAQLVHAAGHFHFRKVAVVVATDKFAAFQFPKLPQLPGQQLPDPMVGPRTLDFDAGLFLHVEIDLRKSGIPSGGVFPEGHLFFTAQMAFNPLKVKLIAELGGPFEFKLGDNLIKLNPVTLSLTLPTPSLMLSGVVDLCIDHTPVKLHGDILLNARELRADLEIDFDAGGLQFFGVEGLFLDELWATLGVSFPPTPGMELGLFGSMHLGDEAPGADAVGILLQLTGGVPVPKYLELRIETLDLTKMVAMFLPHDTSSPVSDLVIQAKRVHLLWAAVEIALPHNRTVYPGFAFTAEFHILGMSAFVSLTATLGQGLEGIGVCSKIEMGPLTISGKSKGYRQLEYQNEKGQWVKVPDATLKAGGPDDNPIVGVERGVVEAGGPEIIVNTHGNPYFHIDFEVSIFKFMNLEVAATMSATKLEFELGFSADDIAGLHLHFCVDKDNGFQAEARCHFQLGGWVGPINLSILADAELKISFDKTDGFRLHVYFHADLFGHTIGPFVLDFHEEFDDLAKLPAKMLATVSALIKQGLADLWALIFGRETDLAEENRAKLEQQRAEQQADNERHQKALEEHERKIAEKAKLEAGEALKIAAAMRTESQRIYAADMERARSLVEMTNARIATLEERLKDIAPTDPHLPIRAQQIHHWNGESTLLNAPRASLSTAQASQIRDNAAQRADRIRMEAEAYAKQLTQNNG